jgi:hypothetical protein
MRACSLRILLITTGLLAVPALGQTTQPLYPESTESLKSHIQVMMEAAEAQDAGRVLAYSRLFVLPNHEEWFKRVFGKEVGDRLIKEYNTKMLDFPENVTKVFLALKDPKIWQITVVKVEAADDVNATVYQKFALVAMVDPVPLYSVTLTPKGTTKSIRIWSFVYVDGAFRMAGQMQASRK